MFNINTWSDNFFSKLNSEMDKELTEIFIRLLMLEKEEDMKGNPFKNEFLYQVISKRAESIGLKINEQTIVFLMYLCKTPGSAIMYLYALRTKIKELTMEKLTLTCPNGFVSEKDLSELWDMQKGINNGEKVDNCLDFFEFKD